MSRLVPLLAFVLTALPADVAACVRMPVGEQSKAEMRHWSQVQTRELARAAAERLASGPVAVADELAEMLVPNIRPVRLLYSSCGPEGEIDFAGGAETIAGDLKTEPGLGGVDLAAHARIIREFGGETFLGPSCNAEFRSTFAAWLKAALSEAELRTAWLFLAARKRQSDSFGTVYNRLITFDRGTRLPPMRWWGRDEWIRRDLERFNSRTSAGRLLRVAMSKFWARQEPTLASDALVCPSAQNAWRSDREQLVAMILREEQTRMLQKAQRQSVPSNGSNPTPAKGQPSGT